MASLIPRNKVVNREAVRILVADIGYTRTSAQTGIKRDTLYKWGQRYGWKVPVTHIQETVQSVQPVADIHSSELALHERETRLSLARSSARMAKDAEHVTLRDSKHVLNVAKTAAITHRWEGQDKQQANIMVNVALLGIRPEEMQNVNATPIEDVKST